MHKDNLIKYIAIGIVLLVLTGFLIANYFLNKPAARTIEGDADYQVDAHQLYTQFEEDEEKANEKYLNKIIAVRGKITDISEPDSLGFTVTLGTDGMFGISCEVADVEKTRFINVGDSITMKGLCTGKLMDVVLVKCIVEEKMLADEER